MGIPTARLMKATGKGENLREMKIYTSQNIYRDVDIYISHIEHIGMVEIILNVE